MVALFLNMSDARKINVVESDEVASLYQPEQVSAYSANLTGSHFHPLVSRLKSLRPLLLSYPLLGDPVVYITGTMDQGDAFCLTCCEETNDIKVD